MMVRSTVLRLLQLVAVGGLTLIAEPGRAEQTDESTDDYINPDRPGIADGSNVVGPGRFQIETGFQQEFRRSSEGHSQTQFVPTLLRLGLNRDLELRVEGNTYTRTTEHNVGLSK